MERKMQVFISSTYKDLIEERQAAVEAILKADHIPAGMELFKAGDETQRTVIQRWIDQSDIYMLIVGGRYGSIEPKSGLSYTHLEFRMAIESGIPIFVIVLNEAMLTQKTLPTNTPCFRKEEIFEIKTKSKKMHKAFIDEIAGDNRIVSYVNNIDQIKAEIILSLSDIIKSKKLSGWVRASESELISENLLLKEQVNDLTEQVKSLKNDNFTNSSSIVQAVMIPHPTLENIGGYQFDEIVRDLRYETVFVNFPFDIRVSKGIEYGHLSALELLMNPYISRRLVEGILSRSKNNDEIDEFILKELIPLLKRFNLIDVRYSQDGFSPSSFSLNPNGSFLLTKLLNR